MMGNIGWVQLLIVLAIVVLLFGTKKLRNIGSDLGGAVKGFKNAVKDEDKQGESQEHLSEQTQTRNDADAEKASQTDKDKA